MLLCYNSYIWVIDMYKILIIEDDLEIRNELKILLDNNGYSGVILDNFDKIKENIISKKADLILLDINIPNINGQHLLKELREEIDTPIIMVTSKNTEIDEVISMSYGADDYITKPYNPNILLLHIEAILKRTNKTNNVLNYKNITLDTSKSMIYHENGEITLSRNEMMIFYYLIKNKGKIVSREDIMNYLWDTEDFIDDNTLTVNIARLRNKLEDAGLTNVIETRRGQGYILI